MAADIPKPPGTLYVAASPLGNLQDISARLIQALNASNGVLAEDTRRSRVLLSHLGIHKPLQSLHSHNEVGKRASLVARIVAGETLLLLSDAGTPGVSDPGAYLVAEAHDAGVTVCPIPGPSALTAALSVSGFAPGDGGVLFVGFLPRHGKDRSRALARLTDHWGVAVVFESPERLGKTLGALAITQPTRPLCLCRELTKMHEEVRLSTVGALAEHYRSAPPRGEITFVLGPMEVEAPTTVDPDADPHPLTLPKSLEAAVAACLAAGVSPKDTAQALAAVFALPRKAVYSCALSQI